MQFNMLFEVALLSEALVTVLTHVGSDLGVNSWMNNQISSFLEFLSTAFMEAHQDSASPLGLWIKGLLALIHQIVILEPLLLSFKSHVRFRFLRLSVRIPFEIFEIEFVGELPGFTWFIAIHTNMRTCSNMDKGQKFIWKNRGVFAITTVQKTSTTKNVRLKCLFEKFGNGGWWPTFHWNGSLRCCDWLQVRSDPSYLQNTFSCSSRTWWDRKRTWGNSTPLSMLERNNLAWASHDLPKEDCNCWPKT